MTTSGTALGHDYRRLWAAYSVSELGSAVGAGALPLIAILLLDATALQVALMAALAATASAAVALPVGAVMPSRPMRPFMLGTDLIRFAALASLPLAVLFGGLTFTQLCIVAVVTAAGNIVYAAASATHLKALVPVDQRTRAASRLETTFWTAASTGPPVGGILVSWAGPAAAAAVDALSFLASAATIRTMRTPESAPAAGTDQQRWPARLAGGWRHLWGHRGLRALFLNSQVFGGAVMLTAPIMPVLMLRDLGLAPWQYGLGVGLPAVGGIAGSLLAAPFTGRLGQRTVLLAFGVARTLPMALIPLAPPGPTGLVVIIIADTVLLACAGVFNPAFVAYRLDATGDRHLPQVLTTWSACSRCVQPAFIAAGGVLASVTSPKTAIAAAAIALLASAAFLPWRQGDQTQTAATAAPAVALPSASSR